MSTMTYALARNKCSYCGGFVEEETVPGDLRDEVVVLHQCIHCARMMPDGFICDPVACHNRRKNDRRVHR